MKWCAFALAILLSPFQSLQSQEADVVQLRGVWLTNVDSKVLYSPKSIDAAMQFLADHHFNVVFPVVWNDALTLYPSRVMDSLFHKPIDPDFAGWDPLAELIAAAQRRNIAVIPWFEYGFSSSFKKNGGHILKSRPQWAARDRKGRLLKKNGFEWMNAYHPEVQEFIIALVKEVVRNYPVDGIQGDDRLPAQPIEGGYSAFTDSLYRASHQGNPPPQNFRDPAWQRWRGDRLNAFARRLYQEVKALKPEVIVSWAPSIYPWSYDEYLQDWPAWIRGGYADLVIPQVYRYSFAEYKRALQGNNPDSLGISPDFTALYPGILMNVGDYRISEQLLLESIALNRQNGFRGEVVFFYEGLRKKRNQLAETLVQYFYQQPASFPLK